MSYFNLSSLSYTCYFVTSLSYSRGTTLHILPSTLHIKHIPWPNKRGKKEKPKLSVDVHLCVAVFNFRSVRQRAANPITA